MSILRCLDVDIKFHDNIKYETSIQLTKKVSKLSLPL